ncbi:MAG: hypothetical protein NC117_02880 [Pseudoflavonifractor sp.]|nr:hypothetical protein [Pseudoflavonifractor sp.]
MEQQNNTGKSHGGRREGAGRKKIDGRDIAVSYRISAEARDRLRAYADALGVSVQEAVNRIFEAL